MKEVFGGGGQVDPLPVNISRRTNLILIELYTIVKVARVVYLKLVFKGLIFKKFDNTNQVMQNPKIQNIWFLENNRALSKFLYKILHYLISIINL